MAALAVTRRFDLTDAQGAMAGSGAGSVLSSAF